MNIIKGKISRSIKLVLYGPEGIGKTTLASQFPDPIFIDLEHGADLMDIRRVEPPASWVEFHTLMKDFIAEKPCKTVIIDTADAAEVLCSNYVCKKNGKTSIEEFGYGKGYTYLGEAFGRFLELCNASIDEGLNIVFTAHAKMRKFEQPDELGAYDRWEMKLSRQVAPMLKEWCDALLFLNFETYVTEVDGKTKAQGGKRVIYADHHACWDAKNRFGLPAKMPLDIKAIERIFKDE